MAAEIIHSMLHQHLLSERIIHLKPSATLKMAQLARDYKAMGRDVISLSLGEPDFDTPEHIKTFAKQALDDGYTKYTPVAGLPELREAICTKLQRDNALNYTPDQILVSNGAKQSISNLCNALLNPGDEIILFAPYWVSYYDIAQLVGARVVSIHATVDQDFKVSPQQLAQAITHKTKMLLFSSPCNPTGSVYSRKELAAFVEVLKEHPNIIIVSDEIYEYINFSKQHASIASFDEVYPQTVTVNGFSKGFAMTGWRLGYMAGPSWLIKACANNQGQCTSGANAFGQKAAAQALLADMGPTERMRQAFKKRRDLVIELLSQIDGMQCNEPQGAFYIFPNITAIYGKTDGTELIRNSEDFCKYILEEAHVALVPGSAFGNDDCFRLSYAASDQILQTAIRRIKTAVEKLK